MGHASGLTRAVHTLLGRVAGSGPVACSEMAIRRRSGLLLPARSRAASGYPAEGCRLGALVLAPRGQFPELIPEEHAEDGVGAQAQVGRAQPLVERQGALLPPDLHQAVGKATIHQALGTDTGRMSLQGSWGPGWHSRWGVSLCRGFCGHQYRGSPQAGNLQKGGP